MNNYLKIALGLFLAAGIGYGFGRYMQPARVETVKVEVIKEVEVIKRDVIIVEKETKLKDGTIIKERTIIDKTVENREKNKETKETKVVESAKPQWKAQGLAGINLAESNKTPVYGIGVEKRFLGPFFLGGYVKTNKEVGLSVSFEF